jgi:hypothetical protein
MRLESPAHQMSSYDDDVESRRPVELASSPERIIPRYRSSSHPFAGRVGANQAFTVEGRTSEDGKLLEREPDATPHMPFRELMDLRPITNIHLWKTALIEGVGKPFLSKTR